LFSGAPQLVQFLTMSSAAFFTPFHPLADFSRLGRGHVLRARIECDTFVRIFRLSARGGAASMPSPTL
jgi:hypothetical protein